MILKKRAYGSVYCLTFGFLLIFNVINTNNYGMYPPSYLVAFGFGIGFAMILGIVYAYVYDPGEKRRIEITYKFAHMKKEIALEKALSKPIANRNPFPKPVASAVPA